MLGVSDVKKNNLELTKNVSARAYISRRSAACMRYAISAQTAGETAADVLILQLQLPRAAAAGRGPADVAARVARRRRPAPVAAAAALRRGLGRALLVAGALGARRRSGGRARRHVRGRLPRGLLRRLRRAGGGAPGLLKKVAEQPPTPPLFGLAHTRF